MAMSERKAGVEILQSLITDDAQVWEVQELRSWREEPCLGRQTETDRENNRTGKHTEP